MPLGFGFLDAADILFEHWKQHRPDDLLVLPILYNYRHGIELTLKRAVRDAVYCARREGVSSWWDTDEEVDSRLNTHKIADLVRHLEECLGRLPGLQGSGNAQLDPDVSEVLAGLHTLDETGQHLRYTTVRTGRGKYARLVPARADQQYVDVEYVAQALRDAGTTILGVSAMLYEYRDCLNRSEE